MTFSRGSNRIVAGYLLLMGATVCPVIGLTTAHASSHEDRTLGAVVFHEKGCEHCHGEDGAGTELGPDLDGVGRSMHKSDIEKQIRTGDKEMPAFGDVLTNDEVKQLVAYLAAKRKKGVKLWDSSNSAGSKN